MKDNTTLTASGIEVYEHDIFLFADDFINKELQVEPNDPDYLKKVGKSFRQMILYIADRIEKPSHKDIKLLDGLFDVFVRLCAKYGRLPTLECFSFLISTHRLTFNSWLNGNFRPEYGDNVRRWKDVCRSFLVDELTNSESTSVNRIFIAKASYGMVETAPAQSEPQALAYRSREEIAARHIGAAEPEKPDLD